MRGVVLSLFYTWVSRDLEKRRSEPRTPQKQPVMLGFESGLSCAKSTVFPQGHAPPAPKCLPDPTPHPTARGLSHGFDEVTVVSKEWTKKVEQWTTLFYIIWRTLLFLIFVKSSLHCIVMLSESQHWSHGITPLLTCWLNSLSNVQGPLAPHTTETSQRAFTHPTSIYRASALLQGPCPRAGPSGLLRDHRCLVEQ